MRTIKLLSTLFISLFLFSSCVEDILEPLGDYEDGFFILNEGHYGAGNASITFISNDYITIEQNVYSTVNSEALGDTAQSVFMKNDKAYIVMNGSNKIEVVNRYTMEKIATIDGASISNPRYFVTIGTTGYVSNWGSAVDPLDDFITVIDLNTNTVTGTIPVGEGPEDMLIDNNKLYVNLQGGWGQNNKVVVIDITSNSVLTSISVGYVPNSITKDNNGDIWVLCGGKPNWTGNETPGELIQIRNDEVFLRDDFNSSEHPEHLTIDANKLYYNLNGKIFSQTVSAFSIAIEAVGLEGYYYGIKANGGKLYTLNAGDFVSEGILKVFDLSSNSELQSITTGIIPNGVTFN
jgi:YVTN family beta-propeller protein